MAGTVNVFFRAEATLDDGSHVVGNLSRPKTITLSSGLVYTRDYSIADDATATKVWDSADFADPMLIILEWTDGPVEIAWGNETSSGNEADTSSFVSSDAAGGWMIFWGDDHATHVGQLPADRNSVDGAGAGVQVEGIDTIWVTQTSGGTITLHVTAYK